MSLENNFNGMALDPSKKKSTQNVEKKDSNEIIGIEQASIELKNIDLPREEYSLEKAKEEKPLMHYSKAGNIFQILRFGIQSSDFKNKFDLVRESSPENEKIAQEICGLRIKQGGSYQGKDSISLSKYSSDLYVPPNNVLYLINPGIKTFGDEERDTTSGYGHGINIKGEYEIGNSIAYKNEVLAANIILPRDIRSVVIGKFDRILRDMGSVVRENVMIYIQQKNRDKRAGEDLVATIKLLSDLSGNKELELKAIELEKQLLEMDSKIICLKIQNLQQEALKEFIGKDKKLDEESIRNAIQIHFNINILDK